MVCLPTYKAGRAETCRMDKVNDIGAGTVSYVRLPDGYLIDCGIGRGSVERAEFVRDAVNVAMKWVHHFPPIGVLEVIIREALADEAKYCPQVTETPHG